MSKKLFFLPALLLGAMLMFAPACGDSDPCKDVKCGDNGACFEGACVCNDGYELGATGLCDTESRVKFYGNYNVSETCTPTANGTYSSTISSGADITKINITNFGDSALNVSATVDGTNITIPSQSLTVSTPNGPVTSSVAGTGSISGSIVTITYTSTGGANFTCTQILTK